jgi:hypothetical protein
MIKTDEIKIPPDFEFFGRPLHYFFLGRGDFNILSDYNSDYSEYNVTVMEA